MISPLDTNQWLPPAREAARILLDAGLKSVVVLAVAGLVLACMRQRSAAARHLVCFLAVASLLVLPVLSWTLPGWHLLPKWTDIRAGSPVVIDHQVKPVSLSQTSSEIDTAPRQRKAVIPTPPDVAPTIRVPGTAGQIVAASTPSSERARINW